MFSKHWVDKEYYNSLDDKYKTSDDVFFIKDANEIYIGKELYIDNCIFYNSAFIPKNPIINKVYVDTSSLRCIIFDGIKWNDYETNDGFNITAKYMPKLVSNNINGPVENPVSFTLTFDDPNVNELFTDGQEMFKNTKIFDYSITDEDIDYIKFVYENGITESVVESLRSLGLDYKLLDFGESTFVYINMMGEIILMIGFPESGIYSGKLLNFDCTITVPEAGTYCNIINQAFEIEERYVYQKIDYKNLPNSDYNQNNPSGTGYIENRPCYFTDKITEVDYSLLEWSDDDAFMEFGCEDLIENDIYRMTINDKYIDLVCKYDQKTKEETELEGEYLGDNLRVIEGVNNNIFDEVTSIEYGFFIGIVSMANMHAIECFVFNNKLFKTLFNISDEDYTNHNFTIKLTHFEKEVIKMDSRLLPNSLFESKDIVKIELGEIFTDADGIEFNKDIKLSDEVNEKFMDIIYNSKQLMFYKPLDILNQGEQFYYIFNIFSKDSNSANYIFTLNTNSIFIKLIYNKINKTIQLNAESIFNNMLVNQSKSSTGIGEAGEIYFSFKNGIGELSIDNILQPGVDEPNFTLENINSSMSGETTTIETNDTTLFTKFSEIINSGLHPEILIKSMGNIRVFPASYVEGTIINIVLNGYYSETGIMNNVIITLMKNSSGKTIMKITK